MKKVISVLLAVLCLTLVLTSAVSAAPGYPSFEEGEIEVVAGPGSYVDKDYHNTGDDGVDQILANPTIANVGGVVPGFPSTSTNDVTFSGDFFDVTDGAHGAVSFTIESDKIVAGVTVGAAHYSTVRALWEYVPATTVDTTNHKATFNLVDSSPVILVISKAKAPAPAPAPSGVVDTATK